MIADIATIHFCPDQPAAQNVAREVYGGKYNWLDLGLIHVVGNTVNDTLPANHIFMVLVTLHRRENWGERILEALRTMCDMYKRENLGFLVIQHPNWEAQGINPKHYPSLVFDPPQSRDDFMNMLDKADLVVTDSGGLQEECALLGKPCIVVRTSTERTALLDSGAVTLVHPDHPEQLREAIDREYQKRYVYGVPGTVSKKIAKILKEELQ